MKTQHVHTKKHKATGRELEFYLFLLKMIFKAEGGKLLYGQKWYSGCVIVSHRANFLCPLKCPGEAGGAVTLDQVGVRLFPVAACPLLHHVIIPLIVTLQRNILTSYIYLYIFVIYYIFTLLSSFTSRCACLRKHVYENNSASPPGIKICSRLYTWSQRRRWCEIVHHFHCLWPWTEAACGNKWHLIQLFHLGCDVYIYCIYAFYMWFLLETCSTSPVSRNIECEHQVVCVLIPGGGVDILPSHLPRCHYK